MMKKKYEIPQMYTEWILDGDVIVTSPTGGNGLVDAGADTEQGYGPLTPFT